MFQKLLSFFRREVSEPDRLIDLDLTLRQLGNNPEQVASFLRENGIKGSKFGCFRCPIANYLRSLLPKEAREHFSSVCVSSASYSITYYTAAENLPISMQGKLPLPVSEFVFQFDHQNAYPHLEQLPRKKITSSWAD
jgi:hypothetical protein